MRAKGMGGRVIVTEVDPVRAIEAVMDGYEVMTMEQAAPLGDVFVCVTGCRDILTTKHFGKMRDGAILCNAGHFNVEIALDELAQLAAERYEARNNIEGFVMPDGRSLFVLAEGRLVNLASGDGHPAEIMDMSFAIQARSAEYLAKHRGLAPDVYPVPREIDRAVAFTKLETLGVEIDSLSDGQREYLGI